MRIVLLVLSLGYLFSSCKNESAKVSNAIKFTTNQISFDIDTTISSIAYFRNEILCLETNGKIAIFDSSYKRQRELEKNLNRHQFDFMFSYHDTLFVVTKNKACFVDTNFTAKAISFKRSLRGDYLYEDSLYYSYGCCVGEFGGAVFFFNKHTQKTYSYFATCATQVLRFNNEYVVCNNLAHLGSHMSFLFVPDPSKLYEITDEKLKNDCNWYEQIDSLRNYWDTSKVGNVRFYKIYNSMSLITFPYKDSLYSVISNDSSTLIVVHKDDTILTRQEVLNKAIRFHQTQIITAGNKRICLYELTMASPFQAYITRGNNSGLLMVEGNKIDILDKFLNHTATPYPHANM